jgi:hypothetical protein
MAYGLTSLKHAAENIGGAAYSGYKLGIGEISGIGKTLPFRAGSIGGMSTLGGLGMAGAGIGVGYTSISNNPSSAATGAVVGAAVGTAALPMAGAVASLGYHVANNLDKIGSAGFSLGRGMLGLGSGSIEMLNSTSPWKNPIGQIANMTQKAAGKLVKYEPETRVWNATQSAMENKGGLKLTGWGKAAVGVTAVAAGAWKAKEAFETSRMGQVDPYITIATPRIPSYQEDAGASGDLVFALNANRRG